MKAYLGRVVADSGKSVQQYDMLSRLSDVSSHGSKRANFASSACVLKGCCLCPSSDPFLNLS